MNSDLAIVNSANAAFQDRRETNDINKKHGPFLLLNEKKRKQKRIQ